MPGERDRLLRLLRGELSVEDCKSFLQPTWQDHAEAEDSDPDAYDGEYGRQRLERECLHRGAIWLLEGAEAYHCPSRLAALDDIAESLDPASLPADFFKRLFLLSRRLDASKSKGPNPKRERDQRIREAWHFLKHDPLSRVDRDGAIEHLSYNERLELMHKVFGRSTKAIERIINNQDFEAMRGARMRYLARAPLARANSLEPRLRAEAALLLRRRARRSPKYRRQTSR